MKKIKMNKIIGVLTICICLQVIPRTGDAICVLDNQKGWWLDCGIRDSYLFRIANMGGIKANFDVGIGVGDDKGFPDSISNTNHQAHHANHHFRRQDDVTRRQGSAPKPVTPPKKLVPPPGTKLYRRQDSNNIPHSTGPPEYIYVNAGNQNVPVIIKQVPVPSKQQQQRPIKNAIAKPIADFLKLSQNTPADTDHVPSFAAKEVIVRGAPLSFYPHDYPDEDKFSQFQPPAKLPRTHFYCEEHKYHPGLYADTQLGCKVFHLCVPASIGSKMTSYLCPNSTLFDQSILQCNWWFNVRCEDTVDNYDANLALAESYRKINAAHLPLSDAHNPNSLALLSPNKLKRSLTIEYLEPNE